MEKKNIAHSFKKYISIMRIIIFNVFIINISCFTGLNCSNSDSSKISSALKAYLIGRNCSGGGACEKKSYPAKKNNYSHVNTFDMSKYKNELKPRWLQDKVVFKLKDYSSETFLNETMNSADFNIAQKKDIDTRIARIKNNHKNRLNIHSINRMFPEQISRKRSYKSYNLMQKSNNGTAEKRLERIYRAGIKSGQKMKDVLQTLYEDPDIEWAEPVFIYDTEAIPNDSYYTNQKSDLKRINLENAWNIETGSSKVVVAVIDTGVKWDHEDLINNIWTNSGEIPDNGIDDDGNGFIDDIRGWDFIEVDGSQVKAGEDPGPSDNDPMDFGGHGTHVAGIIGAQGNNGLGVTGVSWDVSIMPVRAGYIDTTGQQYVVNAPEALCYACDNGADIVNMSFGSPDSSAALREAVDYCAEKGVLLVAATGNQNSNTPQYPAAYEDVISVAGTEGNRKMGLSNFGIWVDIAAPSSNIYSTLVDGGYGTKTGTSMAAPMICGIAALLKSSKPELTAYQLSRHLYAFAVDLSDTEPDYHLDLGAGLVQAVLDKSTSELPDMVRIVSLNYENETRPDDQSFHEGDVIIVRPTIRNFSCNDKNVKIALSFPGTTTSLEGEDTNICMRNVDRDRKITSWSDTLKMRATNLLPEATKDETFIITLSTDNGVISSEVYTITLNYLLGNKSMVSNPQPNDSSYGRPVMAFHPNDGRISMVYRSSLGAPVSSQLYVRMREADGAWGSIQPVPNTSNKQQRNQSVIAGTDGKLHIAWVQYNSDNTGDGIYYTAYNPDSESWEPVTKIADFDNFSVLKSVTSIWLDSDNHPHIAWSDWLSQNDGYIYAKEYDGSSWSGANEAVHITTSFDYSYNKISYFKDREGNYLMVWLQNDGVYYSRFDPISGAKLSGPTSISTGSVLDFSAAADSQHVIHLAFIDPAKNYYAGYTTFDGTSWNAAPIYTTWSADKDRLKIVINNLDNPEMYTTYNYEKNEYGLYRSLLEGGGWSELSKVNPVADAFFNEGDLVITNTGEVVAGFTYNLSMYTSYIFAFTSMERDTLLPSRPAVTLTANESNQLLINFSSTPDGGILGYFLAIGSAPGRDDLMAWTTDLITNTSYTFNLGSLPYMNGQAYYASVIAVGKNGYLSPMGTNHPDVAEECNF